MDLTRGFRGETEVDLTRDFWGETEVDLVCVKHWSAWILNLMWRHLRLKWILHE